MHLVCPPSGCGYPLGLMFHGVFGLSYLRFVVALHWCVVNQPRVTQSHWPANPMMPVKPVSWVRVRQGLQSSNPCPWYQPIWVRKPMTFPIQDSLWLTVLLWIRAVGWILKGRFVFNEKKLVSVVYICKSLYQLVGFFNVVSMVRIVSDLEFCWFVKRRNTEFWVGVWWWWLLLLLLFRCRCCTWWSW